MSQFGFFYSPCALFHLIRVNFIENFEQNFKTSKFIYFFNRAQAKQLLLVKEPGVELVDLIKFKAIPGKAI